MEDFLQQWAMTERIKKDDLWQTTPPLPCIQRFVDGNGIGNRQTKLPEWPSIGTPKARDVLTDLPIQGGGSSISKPNLKNTVEHNKAYEK